LNCLFQVSGQDPFHSRQLTSDLAQECFPTWSPDGSSLVYSFISYQDSLRKTGLWRITADGKNARQIYGVLAEHPRWSPDGRYIVFDADSGKSLKMIPANGGAPLRIVPDSIKIERGAMPCWSPDSRYIAFLEGGTQSLCVADFVTGKVSRIFHQPDRVPFPGCWTRDGSGILVSIMDPQTRKSTLWKISSDGTNTIQITGHHEGLYRYLALSPDGSLLVYGVIELTNGKRRSGFWVMPAEGGKSVPLVSHPSFNDAPMWSPDGKKIAFNSTRTSNHDVWIMDIDISEVLKTLNRESPVAHDPM